MIDKIPTVFAGARPRKAMSSGYILLSIFIRADKTAEIYIDSVVCANDFLEQLFMKRFFTKIFFYEEIFHKEIVREEIVQFQTTVSASTTIITARLSCGFETSPSK